MRTLSVLAMFVTTVLFVTCAGALADEPASVSATWREAVQAELGVEELAFTEVDLPAAGTLPETFDVDIAIAGRTRHVHLRRHDVRSPRFQLLVQRAGGALEPTAPPPSRTYRGRAAGELGTIVAASVLPEGLSAAYLAADGTSWRIHPLRAFVAGADRHMHVVFSQADEPPIDCGVEHDAPGSDYTPSDAPDAPDGGTAGVDECTLWHADLAYDSDYEFFERIGDSDEATALAVIEDGLNINNAIYERDVKITHPLAAAILRTDPETDFYAQWPDASDFGDMLRSFRAEWNANMTHLDYDAAYLLTAKSRPNYGGLAYVGTVCGSSRYGMGIGRRGYEGIMRHELGHNWSCGHSCDTERRYIMCGNSISAFSGYHVRKISRYRDSRSCLEALPYDPDPSVPFPRPDRAVTLQSAGSIPIPVVAGDTDADCDSLHLGAFDERSGFGASLRRIDDLDGGPDGLLYTPRSDFTGADWFSYTVVDDSGNEVAASVLVRVMPRSLVLWLPLDETEGDEADDVSGNGHEGELRGDLTFDVASTAGRYGNALALTGDEDQYLSLGDESEFRIAQRITVAAWFRVDGLSAEGDEEVLSKGSDAYRLKRDGTNPTLRFVATGLAIDGTNDSNLRGTVSVDDGEWHHVAAVFDGTRVYLYIDGELDVSAAASGLINTNSDSLRIGDDGFNGAIDEVRLYNMALDADSIAALFADGRVENPEPAEGETCVAPGTSLAWLAAPSATHHDVYVGTDRDAVTAARVDDPEYRGRRSGAEFEPSLDLGTTYFWRVDEVADGAVARGVVRSFTTSFAHTNFDDPPINASSHSPEGGDTELGFRTESSPTGGDNPIARVVSTGSTSSSPVFAHRSVDATTIFDPVDLSKRDEVLAKVYLQARSTGYEEEDGLAVAVTNGRDEIGVVRLAGGATLSQEAGTGYATYAALLPSDWQVGRLDVWSTTNSGSGSERIDFDRIGFCDHATETVIAATWFDEADANDGTWTPGAGDTELGFETSFTPTSGADSRATIVEAGENADVRFLSHRSVNATTTFDAVDLSAHRGVRATIILRVLDTGYESADRLRIVATSDEASISLVDVTGDTGLDGFADDRYRSFSAPIPDEWDEVTVAVTTSSNSSAGAERYDIRGLEFVTTQPGDAPPPPVTFRRGDADASGMVDITDGIRILGFLFAGAGELDCADAGDTDDSGVLDLSDAISIFGFLFLGNADPPAPGPTECGPDATDDDALDCAGDPNCPL